MDRFCEVIESLPIEKGEILDVASDMFPIIISCRRKKEKFDPDRLIDSLQQKVGKDGTVLIRVWNWDFCHGTPFSIKETPSRVGALGNVALARGDFKRTQHPLYSYMVWGKHQEELCAMQNTNAWGADSTFAFVSRNRGKQLCLGATMLNSFTYNHYVEEHVGVIYRYSKDFTGTYIDGSGNESVRTYQMFVRNLDMDVVPLGGDDLIPKYLDAGVLNSLDFNEVHVSVADIKGTFPFITDDIINNRSRSLCTFIGQEDDDYEYRAFKARREYGGVL